MPSPRPSPALRPSSPLSAGYMSSTTHFDSLAPPSRALHGRSGTTTPRRPNNASLKLPSLPRFHPANFPSAHSSQQTTPDGQGLTPQPPVSPRAHQRMYSDAQKHLLLYQREMYSSAAFRAATPGSQADTKPISPRLAPLGSPGPITPLELEREDGYLLAGARATGRDAATASDELIDSLIREETRRRQQPVSRTPSGSTKR